jgi:hypothetical protein
VCLCWSLMVCVHSFPVREKIQNRNTLIYIYIYIVFYIYDVRLWYCSCHRPYVAVALSIDLLACLYLCRVLWHLDFLNLNFLKNALDENGLFAL